MEKENKNQFDFNAGFADAHDIARFMMEPQVMKDRIKYIKNIVTPAMVLASLGDKDKEFITEHSQNAEYSVTFQVKVLEKAKKLGLPITKEDMERATDAINRTWNQYMSRIDIILALNRNRKENHMINVMSGYINPKSESVPLTEVKQEGVGGAIKEAVSEKKGNKNE